MELGWTYNTSYEWGLAKSLLEWRPRADRRSSGKPFMLWQTIKKMVINRIQIALVIKQWTEIVEAHIQKCMQKINDDGDDDFMSWVGWLTKLPFPS